MEWSRAARWMLAPGAALVGRMRYAHKFAVVGLVLMIPLAVIADAYVQQQRDQISFSSRERVGVAYLAPLSGLIAAVVAARHDVAEAGRLLPARQASLSSAVAEVDAADLAQGTTLGVRTSWAATRRLVTAAQAAPGAGAARVARYDAAVDAVLALVVDVGDASNLTLDPDLDTYYLMDMVQFRLPVLADAVARVTDAAALTGSRAGAAAPTDPVRIQLGIARGVLTSSGTALDHDLTTVVGTTGDDGVRRATRADGERLTAAIRHVTASLEAATQAGGGRLDPSVGLPLQQVVARTSADAARSLDLLLARRIDRLGHRAKRVVAGAVLSGLLAVYLFMGFYLSVLTPIRRIVTSLRAVAGGDLTQRVTVHTRDELRFVADVLNETVAQTRRATDLLTEQATLDPLTGLPNRTLVLAGLDAARTAGLYSWILFVDLDRFKVVNDSLGHGAGDDVLREVAVRMRAVAAPDTQVGRLAGDEFVLLVGPGYGLAHAESLAALIVATLSEPIVLPNGRRATVGASVGIAPVSRSVPAEELLRRADVAMYEAKKGGRGRTVVYDEDLAAVVESRLQLRTELREALDSGGLTVHYQPIVDVPRGRTTGFEALVRWLHPRRGLLLPNDFVGLAEDSSMIVPLGAFVLTTACHRLAGWRAADPRARQLYVSVNVSPLQLSQPDFPAVVAAVLAETGIPPCCLCLEITETSLMADLDRSRLVLADLRALGVQLAIDDFGVGYSSLAYLSRLPVHALKLDRSFVTGMMQDRHEASIVEMMTGLGRSLDLTIVAEGVEEPAQRDLLLRWGYTTMQGYLFGRPVADPGWVPGSVAQPAVAAAEPGELLADPQHLRPGEGGFDGQEQLGDLVPELRPGQHVGQLVGVVGGLLPAGDGGRGAGTERRGG